VNIYKKERKKKKRKKKRKKEGEREAYSMAWVNFTVYRGVSRGQVLVANMSSAYAAHVFLSEGGGKTYP
jgi:hypothetical protein